MVMTLNLPPWLNGLMLSELQCNEPGWLVRQGVGSPPAAAGMSSQVSACYEIKSSGRLVQRVRAGHHTRIRECLGVVRAAGADNRWQGQRSCKIRTLAPCERNSPAKLDSINIQYKPRG